jgi:hypothetical protein
MADNSSPTEPDDGRLTRRYESRAKAVVVQMRTEHPALLHNVSVTGLGLSLEVELDLDEQVKVRLINEVQRFEKEVRGKVRRVSATSDGRFFCGVELYTRLTPLDISHARTNIVSHPDHKGPLWV